MTSFLLATFLLGFLTVTAENLFRIVLEMQPREFDDSEGAGMSREDKVRAVIEDLMERCPEEYNIPELMTRVRFSFDY